MRGPDRRISEGKKCGANEPASNAAAGSIARRIGERERKWNGRVDQKVANNIEEGRRAVAPRAQRLVHPRHREIGCQETAAPLARQPRAISSAAVSPTSADQRNEIGAEPGRLHSRAWSDAGWAMAAGIGQACAAVYGEQASRAARSQSDGAVRWKARVALLDSP